MSKILIGVFLGVFIGSIAYEILARSNPELLKKLVDKSNGRLESLSCPRNRLKVVT
jgi:hypothetical protein